eukprot:COSAG06_NODE_10006_length_1771_cov_1.499402_3_plen_85_part_01
MINLPTDMDDPEKHLRLQEIRRFDPFTFFLSLVEQNAGGDFVQKLDASSSLFALFALTVMSVHNALCEYGRQIGVVSATSSPVTQ